ncbi:peptidylprolyl isomerase [Flavitalea sp.]|nr:peptidylprolyl isomerase [Flavitalea sp.]
MKMRIFLIGFLLMFTGFAFAQKKTIAQLKSELEKSTNPPLYVKDVLKKKFILDTVLIFSTTQFGGVRDSIAYRGKVGKVYGPYDKGRVLVQVLAKSMGSFNRVSQIFLDTSIYTKRFADSLAGSIMKRVSTGTATFEDMVMTYSTGPELAKRGDLGWLAAGSMLPAIEKEMAKRKKGEIFKVWTASGVHILQKTQNPKQDIAAALIMRILL